MVRRLVWVGAGPLLLLVKASYKRNYRTCCSGAWKAVFRPSAAPYFPVWVGRLILQQVLVERPVVGQHLHLAHAAYTGLRGGAGLGRWRPG